MVRLLKFSCQAFHASASNGTTLPSFVAGLMVPIASRIRRLQQLSVVRERRAVFHVSHFARERFRVFEVREVITGERVSQRSIRPREEQEESKNMLSSQIS